MIYVPNLLTLMRIGLVPVIVILIGNHLYAYGLLVFLVAGASDALDGAIAKQFNCETAVGAILDPLADKCLLVSAFVILAIIGHLPFWLVVIVVFRDIIIVAGYLLLNMMHGAIEMKPLFVSKLNTFLQILLIIAVLVQLSGLLPLPDLQLWIGFGCMLVAITSISSGLLYVWKWSLFAMRGDL